MGKTLSTRFLPTSMNITTSPLSVPLLVSQIIAQLKYSQSKGLKHRKQNKLLFQGTYDLSNRLAMRTYLYQVDVTAMIRAMSTCEEKVSMLKTIIKIGLDSVLPMKPKTVHPTELPWINSTLKNMIRKRQVSLGRGKVQHLKNCSPVRWWREIKRLCGMEGPFGSRKSIHHLEGARGYYMQTILRSTSTQLS